ncbi:MULTISPECIES: M16 family metallopeptidase [unclassified Streptomyces]|uniref:M16 family metallopeptidase n=1 Tax=unclassified Streptomyces TaxID=2593676 RepID=UPI0036623138
MSRAPVIRSTLSNGLRIVVQPLTGMPSVGVAVHYDVGFRSELPGRSGFAHLFEHVMFQGSEHVGPADHFRHVQASGGTANGSTHQDHTDFYQVLPASALDRLLFLEADRMRALRVTEETLRTQIAVVKEEIRQSVTDKPYGGFPWTVLPGVLYREFRNAHNGYGSFGDLEAASPEECRAFHETYYTPANAVLTICGNVDPRHALDLADRHFGGIPARPRPAPAFLDEPEPAGELRGEHRDPHAVLAATALGYRLPDPATSLPEYLSHMVLSQMLTGGDSARLKRHTAHRSGLLTDVSSSCGLFGPLRARSPETLVVLAMHPRTTSVDTVLDVLDTEIADLAANGPTGRELDEGRALASTGTWRGFDNLVVRTRALGTYELLFGAAELVDTLAPRLAAVSADDVRSAAAHLARGRRAVLSLITPTGVHR